MDIIFNPLLIPCHVIEENIIRDNSNNNNNSINGCGTRGITTSVVVLRNSLDCVEIVVVPEGGFACGCGQTWCT